MIEYLKKPKIPIHTFFDPLSTEPSEEMNRTEFLFGILKKLNECIKTLNTVSSQVEGFDERISTLESDFVTVKEDLATELAEFKIQVESMITTCLVQAKAYTDTRSSELQDAIDAVIAGQINVYDPTTGLYSPIQQVINNLFDAGRQDAITAGEFDALSLTAQAFDAYQLTAYLFDTQAKTLLV